MASDKQAKAAAANARGEGRPAQPDLWSKIVAIAAAKDISYREATELAVKEYWLEHKLAKKP